MLQNFKTLGYMLQQLVTILDAKQKRRCVFTFFCILLGSLLEMVGVSIILPFLQAMTDPKQLEGRWYVQFGIQLFHITDTDDMLLMLGISVMILYLIKNLFLLFSVYMQNKLSTDINRDMSTLMLRSYMKRSYMFFLDNNSADVLRGINGDVTGVFNIISNLFKLIAEILTCTAIAILLLASDIMMALGVVGLAMICLIAVTLGFKGVMRDMGAKQRESVKYCNQHAYQAVNGIKEITVMQRRESFIRSYDEAVDLKRKTNLAYYFVIACPNRIVEVACVSGIIGVVCIRIGMGVDISRFIPQLGVFAVAAFKILPSIANISGYISGLVFYRPTLEEAFVNITAAREYENELTEYQKLHGGVDEAHMGEVSFKKQVVVKNVRFKYKKAKEPVLQNISLTITKGESIALIGASGAGKTTMADVMLGLLHPESGTVEMDGIDIFSMPKHWAKIIGYVPQMVFLTDDTIRNNVSFGLTRDEIDDDRIWHALEQAQLADFVRKLPKQLDTIVGERGIKFSGGQRQRIAIARALYNEPEILVLDEATSALDNETETAVMEAIDALQGQKTLIIVAHRLTTIRNCDKIYEICDGHAIERAKEEIFS